MVSIVAQAIWYIVEALAGSSSADALWAAIEVASYAVVIGASLAYSNYERKKLEASMSGNGVPVMVRDSTAPRTLVYGNPRVSGPILDLFQSGNNNEYLHIVVAIAGCQLTSIDTIYFGSDKLSLDSSGNVLGCWDSNGIWSTRYNGFATIKMHLGSPTQTADVDLISASGGRWTTAGACKGIAYIYAALKWDSSTFSGGMPSISADVHGLAVYDPRTALTVYSANSALILADFLNQPVLGLNVPYSQMDSSELIASANICDESITKNDLTTEPRYASSGSISSNATPETIMNYMANSMAGTAIYSGGIWFLQAGAHRVPTGITFTEDDFVGAVTVTPRLSRRDVCNSAKGTYIEPKQSWASTDFPPYQNSTYVTQDNSQVIWHDLSFPFNTSASRGTRLAKMEVERTRRQIVVSSDFSLKALQVRAGESVYLTLPRYGFNAQEFEIIEWSLNFKNTNSASGSGSAGAMAPTPTVKMTLREIDSGVFTWANGEEGTFTISSATNLPNPFKVAAPTVLTLTDDSYLQPNNGLFSPRLKVTWTPPADQYVLSGGKIVVEYKQHASPTWVEWSRINGSYTVDWITDIQLGAAYDVRLYAVNNIGAVSSTIEIDNHTVANDTTAPATPTGFSAAIGTGQTVALNWTANTESDLAGYKILRGTSSTFGSATQIAKTTGTAFVDATVSIGTPYWYWLEAYDDFSNTSGAVGSSPASVTPTTVGTGTIDPAIIATITAAQAAANAAQTSANSALTQLTNIASDNILSPVEKPPVVLDYTKITGEQSGIDAQATAYSITTEKTAYDNAVSALTTYLGGLTGWNTIPGSDVAIVGTTWRTNWAAVYSSRQALLNKIAASITSAVVVHITLSTPTAATKTNSGFYQSGDGTIYSWIEITVPGKASDAQGVNLLYRKSGDPSYVIAGQNLTSSSVALRIPDLSPGISYDVATQAFNSFEDYSAQVAATSSPFPAPNSTGGPINPSSGFAGYAPSSTYPAPAQYAVLSNTQMLASVFTWNPTTDKSADHYELGLSTSSTVAPASAYGTAVASASQFVFYEVGPIFTHLYVWIRTLDKSGNASSWVYSGVDLQTLFGYPAGTMSSQNATSVDVNRLYVSSSGASSPTKIDVRVDDEFVVTLAGGARFQDFNVNLTGRGVTGGITTGFGHVIDPPNTGIIALFHLAAAGNSNTNAVMTAQTTDGTAIPAGNYRFAINLKQL